MKKCKERMVKLAEGLRRNKDTFLALGDETRQLIILALLESESTGIRVGEITKKTHLSRPAVSHHLKILKEAGVISMRREGTKNYYFVCSEESHWKEIADLTNYIYDIAKEVSCNNKIEE